MSDFNISSISTVNKFTSSVNTESARAARSGQSFSDVLRGAGAMSSGSADLDAIFEAAGQRYNLPANLLKAVAQVESNFRPNATSRAGAQGIMQLMPATARHLGVEDSFDPEQNIMGGARYLRGLLDRFEGDLSLALAAYNAGWPTVVRHGGIPPFAETQAYVPRVLELFNGGNITAGVVNLNGQGSPQNAAPAPQPTPPARQAPQDNGMAAMTDMLNQMMMMRMMEMQMGGSRNGGLF